MTELKKFNPLPDDHPLVAKGGPTCAACQHVFVPGDVTALVAIGPGDDPEERERCREGRYYNAVSVPAHWACVTGEED
jgi:hypothetical protein